MREAMRLRHAQCLALFTAAALTVPMTAVPAVADDPAAAPTVVTGTAYLPDATTIAPATVIDLSLAGAAPFARTVSDTSGRFSIDLPENRELVTAALANGGSVPVHWTASKLYDQLDSAPSSSNLGSVYRHDPGFAQKTGEFLAWLIDGDQIVDDSLGYVWWAEGIVRDALGTYKHVEFHLPDTASLDPLVTTAADLLAAAGVYNDPDLVAGNDNLDDPDLIPPLGAEFYEIAVTPSTSSDLNSVLPEFGTAGIESGCPRAGTWLLPNRNPATAPMRGTQYAAQLALDHCTNEEDGENDYWSWAWDGRITNKDTPEEYVTIWRYKFRTQLLDSAYDKIDVAPEQDVELGNGDQVHWRLGLAAGSSISGDYTYRRARKIHPWQDYDPKKLYHVSWISESSVGSRNEDYFDGGAMFFMVPQGLKFKDVNRQAKNTVQTWRCWTPKNWGYNNPSGWSCDPR